VKPLRALLVNPYIYDFAAYNFWSSPLGLLYVGAILRKNGAQVRLIDCLRVEEAKRKKDGRAPFIKERVEAPDSLKGFRKRYRRYGISPESLQAEFSAIDPPDLVLITTIMTYWYRGAQEVLRTAREFFPKAKIVLGGIYPSLCYDHALAQMIGADLIVRNNEIGRFYQYVEGVLSFPLPFKPRATDFASMPRPCYDLYRTIPFVPLVTSYGCIYRCTYCATQHLYPRISRRDPGDTLDEIIYWHERGVDKFVLYDDNFLYKKDLYAKPLLEAIARLSFPVNLYNPNAVNAALLDDSLALLLVAAGFKEVRMGLETIDPSLQRSTGGKVAMKTFEGALRALAGAGLKGNDVGAYVLAGLPLQRWQDVRASVDYLFALGVRPHIAEYTPIPHTPMYDQFQHLARYPVSDDPAFQNNALFPFAWEGFTEEDLRNVKEHVRKNCLHSMGSFPPQDR
jgi:radical SAM superfamily enzyme YgiQ (UPF0313 family)